MSLIGKWLPASKGQGVVAESTPNPVQDELQRVTQVKKILEQALGHIKEGVITTDNGNIVTWANRSALETLKTTWSLAQGKPINQVLPNIENLLTQPEIKIELTTLDGDRISVSVEIFPLLDDKGVPIGKIFTLRDVTEEATLDTMKVDFVAISAHQLRTPLTAMKGYLAILAQSAMPKLDQKEQLFLQRALVSTNRLGSLIENLLNVSRIEKGALKVTFQPVNIEEVVKQTVANLTESAQQNNVKLESDLRFAPYPSIMGDANLLSEALTNVITNSIKYNHPGGQVSLALEKQTDGIVIHVSDTGKGISSEALPHLFERFYAGSSKLSELSNGLGLGLFISKSIIEAHKGKIVVNSLEGKGTTVSITLPLQSQ